MKRRSIVTRTGPLTAATWALSAMLAACGGGGESAPSATATNGTQNAASASEATMTDAAALRVGARKCGRYLFAALETLGGHRSAATGINDEGDVVGSSSLPGDSAAHAVLWSSGRTIDLGTLGGQNSYANGINKHGFIVGQSEAVDAASHATLWRQRKATDLGLQGGKSSTATAINDRGQIVGFASGTQASSRGILWEDKSVAVLAPASGQAWVSSMPVALNDRGQVAGTSLAVFADDRIATSWNAKGQATALEGATDSASLGINNAGTVVGYAGFHPGFSGSPTLWHGMAATLLQGLFANPQGRYEGKANAINNDGIVVGSVAVDANGTRHAVAWLRQGAAPVDLNSLLDSEAIGAGWVLVDANAVNAGGSIAGAASNALTGEVHAYLLTRRGASTSQSPLAEACRH